MKIYPTFSVFTLPLTKDDVSPQRKKKERERDEGKDDQITINSQECVNRVNTGGAEEDEGKEGRVGSEKGKQKAFNKQVSIVTKM